MFSPLFPALLAWLLVAAAAGLVVTAGVVSRLRDRWWSLGRRLGMVVLAFVVVMNPQSNGSLTAEAEALDIFVVIDTSISMTATDWQEDQARLVGVVADCEELALLHAGARFSLITFDRLASRRVGLTRDNAAFVSAVQTIKPPPEAYAGGTSIDAALPLLVEVLEQAKQNDPTRGRVVYYLGDGEQTRSNEPESFAAVKDLADGGAVLGYGSEAGARMPVSRGGANTDNSTTNQRRQAVSKIDQPALRTIARQAGLEYQHRTKPGGLEKVAFTGSFARDGDGQVQTKRSLAWLAAFGLLALAAWEAASQAAAYRRASLLTRAAKEV